MNSKNINVDRAKLIRICRYYGGEETSPFQTDSLSFFWELEKGYVNNPELNEEMDHYYRAIGGNDYPGIPRALLIRIFTSWGKDAYDLKKELPYFYQIIDDYLFVASDHFPIDEIPGE